MSKEIRYILDQICHEKGIPKGVLIEMIESAMLTAIRKKFSKDEDITLKIIPNTFEISVYALKTVVDVINSPKTEILFEEAKQYDEAVELGSIVQIPLDVKDLGRIAAQTVKQVILQKVREAERGVIYEKYIDKVGTIIAGTVLRKDRGNYIIGIGKAEAVLPAKETINNEHLKIGDTVRAYIDSVNPAAKGPQITLTRINTDFVAELFRIEVPEINDGIVEIKDVVREAGERTKIAVYSKDSSIDPVGACVGMKGTRVQSIVRELRGERIDIINWTDDPRLYIARALTPSEVDKIGINEEDKNAMVVVDDSQLSLAIGKKGQNVKLAMKLTGWDIDIISESNYSKIRMDDAQNVVGNVNKNEEN
ncbi:MAG: transcription termination factor NusA [Candidatus Magnetoovum sp. WYHC-5]|nr:transcription termination factor NusA [Candidatus Magnetoovum sp. WYHC-5]